MLQPSTAVYRDMFMHRGSLQCICLQAHGDLHSRQDVHVEQVNSVGVFVAIGTPTRLCFSLELTP